MTDLAECFSANLVRYRRLAGLSQEEVGIRAGTHRTEVSQLERGLRVPRLDTAMKLAAAVGVDLAQLVEGMTWISGSYRPGSFVDGGHMPPATSGPTTP